MEIDEEYSQLQQYVLFCHVEVTFFPNQFSFLLYYYIEKDKGIVLF